MVLLVIQSFLLIWNHQMYESTALTYYYSQEFKGYYFAPDLNSDALILYSAPNSESERFHYTLLNPQLDINNFRGLPNWMDPALGSIIDGQFFFRLTNAINGFYEVVVSEFENLVFYIQQDRGNLLHITEIVNLATEVILPGLEINKIHLFPDMYSPEIINYYLYLIPIEIRGEWIRVRLFEDVRRSMGTGWVKWRDGDQVLVNFAFLKRPE